MRRLALLGIAVLSLTALEAHAATPRLGFRAALIMGTPQIPAAWSGIWVTTDSVYNCSDPPSLLGTSTSTDTLCAAGEYTEEFQDVEMTCDGSADDNTATLTCTGLFPIDKTCSVQFTMETVATRTGETAFTSAQITGTPTPPGCIPFALCQTIRSHMTRTGPAPKDCALTPVRPSTWGRVKSIYR